MNIQWRDADDYTSSKRWIRRRDKPQNGRICSGWKPRCQLDSRGTSIAPVIKRRELVSRLSRGQKYRREIRCADVTAVTRVTSYPARVRAIDHIKLIIIDLDRAGDSGCRWQNRDNLVGLRDVIANSRSSSRDEFLRELLLRKSGSSGVRLKANGCRIEWKKNTIESKTDARPLVKDKYKVRGIMMISTISMTMLTKIFIGQTPTKWFIRLFISNRIDHLIGLSDWKFFLV